MTIKSKVDYNNEIFVTTKISIIVALERMNSINKKMLIVLNNNEFYSILSIGDIQRAIINKCNLEDSIINILRKDVVFCKKNDSETEIKDKMIKYRIECMPILDNSNKLINLIFWDQIIETNFEKNSLKLELPVIIMAGGKGTRLKPLTNIIPKALLPINDKSIIENIMDRFVDIGCNSFHISINYKANFIKNYFYEINNKNYNIKYFEEEKPLGTAGSLYLLKNIIKKTFFVTNCDILIDQDLVEIFEYHKSNKNLITIVSALKNYKIPYGTLETKENGILEKLDEKPDLLFQINTGMYILEPETLDLLPNNEFYHITELIELLIVKNGRVGVFPIAEKSWHDIGNWNDYNQLLNKKF